MMTWVLALMVALQPVAPWRDTYESTANAIAQDATEISVYKGAHGAERTAVLLVALAWFESRFDPNAHNPKDPGGGSFGLFQASRVPLPDVHDQTRGALTAIRVSFRACSSLPVDKWLSHYTTGGPVCFPTHESSHRMALAMRLWKEHPAP